LCNSCAQGMLKLIKLIDPQGSQSSPCTSSQIPNRNRQLYRRQRMPREPKAIPGADRRRQAEAAALGSSQRLLIDEQKIFSLPGSSRIGPDVCRARAVGPWRKSRAFTALKGPTGHYVPVPASIDCQQLAGAEISGIPCRKAFVAENLMRLTRDRGLNSAPESFTSGSQTPHVDYDMVRTWRCLFLRAKKASFSAPRRPVKIVSL
jgi:hypothetical protein